MADEFLIYSEYEYVNNTYTVILTYTAIPSGRPVRRRVRRRGKAVHWGVRRGADPDGVREHHAEEGTADHGHRAQGQVDQQPRHEGDARQGLCQGQLPLHAAPRLRARRREDHDLEEAKLDTERGRLHRRLLRRSPPQLWLLHQGRGRPVRGYGQPQRALRLGQEHRVHR